MSSPKILITGGSGSIGKHLRKIFAQNNYHAKILTRNQHPGQDGFHWNLDSNYIDPKAFDETGTIIHLAGANLNDGRWTAKRKKEIIDSRVKTAALIFEKLKSTSHEVRTFISASGTGIYGNTGDVEVNETSASGNDFSAEVCRQWEEEAKKFSGIGIRVVILRVGPVMAKESGALPELALPVKFFGSAPLGTGKQVMSWIHLEDACAAYLKAVEDTTMQGVFNVVAPNPVSNRDLMKAFAKILHRPFWPFHIPSFALELLLGEKAGIALGGQRVSSKKIQQAGFKFQFENIESALSDLLK